MVTAGSTCRYVLIHFSYSGAGSVAPAPWTRAAATAPSSASAAMAATATRRREGSGPIALAELAGHVLLGELCLGILEDLLRRARLDEIPGPAALGDVDREERGDVGDALGLLHVVGDDGDRVVRLELDHQLLDAARGD